LVSWLVLNRLPLFLAFAGLFIKHEGKIYLDGGKRDCYNKGGSQKYFEPKGDMFDDSGKGDKRITE